jgi:hypothetical protein
MESMSMRDNLVIVGMPEVQDESENDIRNSLLKLFEETLLIEDASSIRIARCHRIFRRARKNQPKDARPRDIVARFAYFPDRQRVFRNARNLQGHEPQMFINEQFPAEIDRRRRVLRPVMKAAKNKNLRASLSRDKLIIEGKSYTVDTISDVPFSTYDIGTVKTDEHVFFSGPLSPFSNFHRCHFTINDIRYCSVEQYYQSAKAKSAKDYVSEAEIMSTEDPVAMLHVGKRVIVDQRQWAAAEMQEMEKALRAKFGQSQMLLKEL